MHQLQLLISLVNGLFDFKLFIYPNHAIVIKVFPFGKWITFFSEIFRVQAEEADFFRIGMEGVPS